MNNYLAKSDGETIIAHTLELLENFRRLEQLYPEIKVDWSLLKLACSYHDLGKMNVKFQEKVKRNRSTVDGEIPHGLLSASLLPEEWLEERYSTSDIQAIAYAVAYHHERDFSKIIAEQYEAEIEALEDEAENFPFHHLGLESHEPEELREEYFEIGTRLTAKYDTEAYPKYVMIKGLLNRIDHAASAHEYVEYPNDFLMECMEKLGYHWNSLQEYMKEQQDKNVVVIAQTGIGKTEAGLLWLGNNKGFFTLPLRAAINAIYKRIYDGIVTESQEERVGLLHSETFNQYLKLDDGKLEVGIGEYENRTKQWALPLTICTLDQVFDFVYRYGGYEQKLATLSYSKVIIDEIQMYSADLLAYLIKGLKYITDYGGNFAILTATMPPFIVDLLRENQIDFEMPEKPFIDETLPLRHSIEVIHDEINADAIHNQYNENRILVICNTIKQAKKIYRELQERVDSKEIHLLHSQFIKKDRGEKEAEIMAFGRVPTKENRKIGIWVATQVVEASLDIDFDLLLTELTDLNGLFQRMGRCYRKRPWIEQIGINVRVFDEKCSGIGYVVDKKLHELSKEALLNIYGSLTEMDKMQLIEATYTTDNVAGSEYLENTQTYLKYLDVLFENEKKHSEVKKIFRNIHSTSLIPAPIYQENKEEIDGLVEQLQKRSKKGSSLMSKEELRREKKEVRAKLSNYKVDLPDYILDREMFAIPLKVNRYESIQILDCFYSKELGVTLKKPEKEDNFF